jgi:hypothetical protein
MATRRPKSTTQAVTQGLAHLAEATMATGLRAIQDVGTELRTAGQRTANGSLTAARDIGGDLAMLGQGVAARWRSFARPPVKAAGRRRRRRAA